MLMQFSKSCFKIVECNIVQITKFIIIQFQFENVYKMTFMINIFILKGIQFEIVLL